MSRREKPEGSDAAPILPVSAYRFNYRKRFFGNALSLLLTDTLLLLLAVLVGRQILFAVHGVQVGVDRLLIVIPLWWMGALLINLTPGWGLGPVEKLRRAEILLFSIFAMLIAAQFVVRVGRDPSRIAYFSAFGIAALLLPLGRAFVRGILHRRGVWGLPVVIYGNDETADHAVRAMRDEPGLGYSPIGIFDNDRPTGSELDGVPVLGDLFEGTRAASVAILAAPTMPRAQIAALLDGPLSRYRRVIILPDMLDIPSLWVKPCDFLGVLGLEITRNLLNPLVRGLKNSLERAVTVVTLPVWGPILGVLALAIWLEDRANPFFLQHRLGREGDRFRVVKFRTMHPNAEELLKKRLAEDEELRAEWEARCKLRNDPRITRVGRWLRRTSMDELPQLLNVFMGSMSLVGPRPLPPYHHLRLPDHVRELREQVRPGITGLWQVSGRSESGDEGLTRWDAYYVRNWSPWLDLVILARTAQAVLTGRGAY